MALPKSRKTPDSGNSWTQGEGMPLRGACRVVVAQAVRGARGDNAANHDHTRDLAQGTI